MKQKQIFTFRDAEKQVAPAAFSIMLKPAGSACNLDCHYCYYLDTIPIIVRAVRIISAASCFKPERHFFSGMAMDLEIYPWRPSG